jgi:hypothetical protein
MRITGSSGKLGEVDITNEEQKGTRSKRRDAKSEGPPRIPSFSVKTTIRMISTEQVRSLSPIPSLVNLPEPTVCFAFNGVIPGCSTSNLHDSQRLVLYSVMMADVSCSQCCILFYQPTDELNNHRTDNCKPRSDPSPTSLLPSDAFQ